MNSIKIMICCHKQCEVPKDSIYLPIQVGRKRNDIDLGIQSDSQIKGVDCDNISQYNNIYCEMTAMYWAWKNIDDLYSDIKYVGLCHYRRYFNVNWTLIDSFKIFAKKILYTGAALIKKNVYGIEPMTLIKSVSSNDMKKNSEKLGKYVMKYDVIATRPFQMLYCNTNMFFQVIGRKYIELLTEIVDQEFPKYSKAFREQLMSNQLYAQNMIILKRELLDEYASFIFGVLQRHIELTRERNICKDPTSELTYDRLSGYLSEILTSTFIRYAKSKYRVGLTAKYFVE